MKRKKVRDSIPEQFATYEEAAEFWDRHDTTDYPEAFRTVKVQADLHSRHLEVEIEPQVENLLRSQARRRRLSVVQLVNRILRQALTTSA